MMKRKVLIGVVVVLFPVGVLALKKNKEEPRLPYQLPALSSKEAGTQSRYEEYESVLAGREPRPVQAKTQEARFSFTRLFKKAPQEPQATPEPLPQPEAEVTRKPLKAVSKKKGKPSKRKPAFFSYQGQSQAHHFVKAIIYRDQQVRAGEGIVVQLKDTCQAGKKTLAAGTLLYGAARMRGNRLLVTLTAASEGEKRFPVSMTCYDTDLLPGIAYAGASAWEGPREQAIDRVLRQADKGLLKEIGQGASIAYKAWRRKPAATLDDGRIVYVSPLEK